MPLDFYFIAPTTPQNNAAGSPRGLKYMVRALDGRTMFKDARLEMVVAQDICDELNAARNHQP